MMAIPPSYNVVASLHPRPGQKKTYNDKHIAFLIFHTTQEKFAQLKANIKPRFFPLKFHEFSKFKNFIKDFWIGREISYAINQKLVVFKKIDKNAQIEGFSIHYKNDSGCYKPKTPPPPLQIVANPKKPFPLLTTTFVHSPLECPLPIQNSYILRFCAQKRN